MHDENLMVHAILRLLRGIEHKNINYFRINMLNASMYLFGNDSVNLRKIFVAHHLENGIDTNYL